MGLAGTAKIQNGRLNHCRLISDSHLKIEDRGDFREVYDKTSKLFAVKWNDNSIVKLILNVYASEPTSNATRYSRKDSKKISIQKPNIVAQYNNNMGGVDYLDSKVASYRISIRGKKLVVSFH